MTGAILAALAVFVAGHGDSNITEGYIEKSEVVYERWYTGETCGLIKHYQVGKSILRECHTRPYYDDDNRNRGTEFYIVFDIKNKTRERHRKTTLLWLYAKQRYETRK